MNTNFFPSPAPASSSEVKSRANAKPAKNSRGTERSSVGKSVEKNQSFADTLARAEGNKKQLEKQATTKANQKSSLEAKENRAQQSKPDRKINTEASKSSTEVDKGGPKRPGKKRSESLKKVGKLIGQGASAAKKSPALKLLTGDFAGLSADSIPQIVSRSGFIRGAISADIPDYMQSPTSVSEIISQLDLTDSVEAQAESLGLDLEEKVSPIDFFKAIGIDPQRIVAELSRLKDGLPQDGLSKYMAQATAFNEKLGTEKTGLSVVKPEIAGNIGPKKKTGEISEILGGLPGVSPNIPSLNTSATNIASEPKLAGANQKAGLNGEGEFVSQPDSLGSSGIDSSKSLESSAEKQPASLAQAFTRGLSSSGKFGSGSGLNSQPSSNQSIQGEMISMFQSSDQSVDSKISSLDGSVLEPQEQTVNQIQTSSSFTGQNIVQSGIAQANSPKSGASTESLGGSATGLKLDGETSKFSTEDIMKNFENSMDSKSSKKYSQATNSQNIQNSGNLIGSENLADQLRRNQLGLDSSVSTASSLKNNLAQKSVESGQEQTALGQLSSFEKGIQAQQGKNIESNQLKAVSGFQNKIQTDAVKPQALESQPAKVSQSSEALAQKTTADADTDSNGQRDQGQKNPSDSGGNLDRGFQKLTNSIGPQARTSGAFEIDSPIKDVAKLPDDFRTKIMDKIDMMVQGRKSAAVIKLDSPELGQLSLAIQVNEDKVNIKIISSSEKVRSMFGAEVPKLSEAMALQNLQLTDVESSAGKDLLDSNDQGQMREQLSQEFSGQFSEDGSKNFSNKSKSNIDSILSNMPTRLKPMMPKMMSSSLSSGRIQVMA